MLKCKRTRVQMCWSRALLTSWVLLLVHLLFLEAVPISIDKTKVKQPETKTEEPPASAVRCQQVDHFTSFVIASIVVISL